MNKKTWLWIAAGVVTVNVVVNVAAHAAFAPRVKALKAAPEGLTEQQLIDAGPAGPLGVLTKVAMANIGHLVNIGILIESTENGETTYTLDPARKDELGHSWVKPAASAPAPAAA
ncbi:MAG: hypothetical protein LBH13_05595 [Cellulomonadaceae bacterium]|nr:hypothetical protein [Cellulomonadaceae bacterium]